MDANVDRAILDATRRLLAHTSVADITMDAIAREAGVGRQSLYRRYASRREAVLAALADIGEARIAVRRSGDLARDVERFLLRTFATLRGVSVHIRALMAQAQMDDDARRALREGLIARRRDAFRNLIAGHAHDPGRLEFALDLAFGVMWYRFLVEHAPLSRHTARELARVIAAEVAPRDGGRP